MSTKLYDHEAKHFNRSCSVLLIRPVKRQPQYVCSDRNFDAEVGDKVMYRGWPCYLRESRGRNKAAAGVLTPVCASCPIGFPGENIVVQAKFPIVPPLSVEGYHAELTTIIVKRTGEITQSEIRTTGMRVDSMIPWALLELFWDSVNPSEPYRWRDNPYVWCVFLRRST